MLIIKLIIFIRSSFVMYTNSSFFHLHGIKNDLASVPRRPDQVRSIPLSFTRISHPVPVSLPAAPEDWCVPVWDPALP